MFPFECSCNTFPYSNVIKNSFSIKLSDNLYKFDRMDMLSPISGVCGEDAIGETSTLCPPEYGLLKSSVDSIPIYRLLFPLPETC